MALAVIAGALSAAAPAHALYDYWLGEVDYNKLKGAIGTRIPTGMGIPIAHVEAAGSGGAYYIDTNNFFAPGEFTDLTPTNLGSGLSGETSTSTTQHSTNVGALLYGNTSSAAPGADNVTIYEANGWSKNVLRVDPDASDSDNPDVPMVQDYRVQNHSWVYSYIYTVENVPHAPYAPHPRNIDALKRFDYMIDTANAGQGMTAVVGLDNNLNSIPYLMSNSYNAIVVGRTDGQHSSGLTQAEYGLGRSKPDIVAPRPVNTGIPTSQTSWSTPMVGSTATMLYEEMLKPPANPAAAQSEVMKAMLMAGATKTKDDGNRFTVDPSEFFRPWVHTTTQPLDDTFGAGELNVYNSYVITQGGRGEGSLAAPTAAVPNYGWDYQDFKNQTVGDVSYKFVVPIGSIAPELSIILAWNIRVTDGSANTGFQPTTLLKDFDLELYNSSNTLIDFSTSLVDNVEHIHMTNLVSGEYTLKVTGKAGTEAIPEFAAGASGWDYGLAWRMATLFDVDDGDFDNDGFVNGNDLLTWQQNLGTLVGASNAQGDANGDGAVNRLDLTIITDAIAAHQDPPMAVNSIAQIPEPATLVSAFAALGALAAARRAARGRRNS